MPGQFILQYYVDNTAKKLKGSVDLDQCEQVRLKFLQKIKYHTKYLVPG